MVRAENKDKGSCDLYRESFNLFFMKYKTFIPSAFTYTDKADNVRNFLSLAKNGQAFLVVSKTKLLNVLASAALILKLHY